MKNIFLILLIAFCAVASALADPVPAENIAKLTSDKTEATQTIQAFLNRIYKEENFNLGDNSLFSPYVSGDHRYLIAKAYITLYNKNPLQQVRGMILDVDSGWALDVSEALLDYFVRTGDRSRLAQEPNLDPNAAENPGYDQPRAPTIEPLIPTPAPSATGAQASVLEFINTFWNHSIGNDPGDWASDFAAHTRYCYSDSGVADRGAIRHDRAKLVDRYPVRHYKFYEPSIQMESGDRSARVSFIYTYSYSGRRSAAGSCRVSLTVEWNSGRWFITDYDEKVDRQ